MASEIQGEGWQAQGGRLVGVTRPERQTLQGRL